MRQPSEALESKLELAASLFAERGYERTSLSDIAEVTGISRTQLYYYFDGKKELLDWLIRRMFDAAARVSAETIIETESARRRLELLLQRQFQLLDRLPDLARTCLLEFGTVARAPEFSAEVERAFFAPVRFLLDEGARDGSIRPTTSPQAAGALFYGSYLVAGMGYLLAPGEPDRGALDAVVPMVLAGLGAVP